MTRPVVAVTGHRFYERDEPPGLRIRLASLLQDLDPRGCLTGMAIGFDMLAAEVCRDLGIPYLAAVPFKGQESRWPPAVRARYQRLLDTAIQVRFISQPGYAAWKLEARNRWMIDHANLVVAYFTGKPGGTANCLQYAKGLGIEILNAAQREDQLS